MKELQKTDRIGCGVIQDLLPLYADGICSPETKALVEEHLGGCEACGELLERMQEPIKPSRTKKDYAAKKAFRKVRSRWIASILAVILLIPAALLTINQVTNNGHISFTNLPAVLTANRYAQHIKNGDIDEIFEGMKPGLTQKYQAISQDDRMLYGPYRFQPAEIGGFSCYLEQTIYDNEYRAYEESGDERAFWAAMVSGKKGIIPADAYRALLSEEGLVRETDREEYVNQIYWGKSFYVPRELLSKSPKASLIPYGSEILPAEFSAGDLNFYYCLPGELPDIREDATVRVEYGWNKTFTNLDQYLEVCQDQLTLNYRQLESEEISIRDIRFIRAATIQPGAILVTYDLVYEKESQAIEGAALHILYTEGEITDAYLGYSPDLNDTLTGLLDVEPLVYQYYPD